MASLLLLMKKEFIILLLGIVPLAAGLATPPKTLIINGKGKVAPFMHSLFLED